MRTQNATRDWQVGSCDGEPKLAAGRKDLVRLDHSLLALVQKPLRSKMSRLVWADGVYMVWFKASNNMLTECHLVASGAAYYQLHMQSTPWYVDEVHPFAFKSWSITYQSGWWFGTWILCFHILGIILPFDEYFSRWLKPPTSQLSIYIDLASTDCLHIGCPKSTFVSAKLLVKFLIIQTLGFSGIYTILLARLPPNWIIHKHNPFIPSATKDTLKRCPRKP